MPRASAADAAKTAATVLDTADRLFAERGYAHVSLDDVARAAHVTRGAIYHHYANKLGLFTAVVSTHQAAVASQVAADAETEQSAQAQLRIGSHAFLDAITSTERARILLIDAPAVIGWESWRALDAEHSMQHLRTALAAVGVSADLLDALTAQLSGAMNEAALWIMQQPEPSVARERAQTALDRLLDAVV